MFGCLIVEAIGSSGHRYFTAYTSSAISGSWTALAASQSNPFIAASNVTFGGTAWTHDFSSGEMIRAGYDQTLNIGPCNIQYLYQGHDPSATGSYNSLPWRLGLVPDQLHLLTGNQGAGDRAPGENTGRRQSHRAGSRTANGNAVILPHTEQKGSGPDESPATVSAHESGVVAGGCHGGAHRRRAGQHRARQWHGAGRDVAAM